ncbi:expressed unknown protein [Seminavis robusta]|uniref:Uncharacterized protein n=2 Tax=Seminavis robusta TaxID=568900 RepID=A0A9N8DEG2_9STRA|nr:expressed unknown protein [Seminavis robusta]|eukprot:Sro80_g043240.1 n/a (1029) ;mRNA; f:93979-97065
MRYTPTILLPLLSLWLAPCSVSGQGILRREHQNQIRRSLRQDPKNPKRSPKSQRRELQRFASVCTDGPTAFSTSLYVTLIGDGTPFGEDDLNSLLRMSLSAFNQADAASCDSTYRTLTSVSVSDVYYTQGLDYIRLRYDVSGSCDGCLPNQLDSGIGPLFGRAEMLGRGRRSLTEFQQPQQQQQQQQQQQSKRRIKGRSNRSRRLGKDDKGGKDKSDDETPAGTNPQDQGQGQAQGQGQPTQVVSYQDQDGDDGDTSFPVNGAGVCGCAMGTTAIVLRGPTPSEFGLQLNTMIEAARAANTLSGVSHVEDLFEAGVPGQSTVLPSVQARQVAASCAAPGNQGNFRTTLWVEVIPINQAVLDLQEPEKLPLEVAILESYNEMNLVSCDLPFFRTLSSVTHQESRRSGDKLQMRFDVTGKCVTCNPTQVTLFDDTMTNTVDVVSLGRSSYSVFNVTGFRPPSQSLLVSEIERLQQAQAGPTTIFRDTDASCSCPLNTDNLPLRPPTTVEFTQILQTTVNTLRSSNYITSFQTVVRTKEIEMDAVCSAEPQTFVSTVLVDFDGRPDLLGGSEVKTLEGGFMDTYNSLIFESCDQYYRSILRVRLIPGVSRRRKKRSLQATSVGNAANSSDIPDLQSEAPSVYMVTGSCRGCPVSPTGTFSLVDDAFRFRKLMEGADDAEVMVPFYSYGSIAEAIKGFMSVGTTETSGEDCAGKTQRHLQECVCAPGTTADVPFAPQANDFRLQYNDEIRRYNEEGTVVNVQGVEALLEIPPGLVSVGFSIFYGTLERVGNATREDYPQLLATTTAFYRNSLKSYYKDQDLSLRAVNVAWNASTPRQDLNMLRVDFTAELIFEDSPNIPTPEQVSFVMEQLNYVDYITQHVWTLNAQNSIFRNSHSVRFAGSEAVLVKSRMLFTVGSDRSGADPNIDDRDGLTQQVNRFFLDSLRLAGFRVLSVNAHIHAEDIEIIQIGSVQVNFDAAVVFSKEAPIPSEEEVTRAIQSLDLEVLRTQYLGSGGPLGTSVFSDPFAVVFVWP